MEIRDVIHGSIAIDSTELPVIDSRYFQRLRQIKQLGFAENSFPSATHNRYIHSLGAMHTATRAFDTIFAQHDPKKIARFRSAVRLAALLHDVGHGPLSHTTEFAMPDVRELKVPGVSPAPGSKAKSRKATHEDYTLKLILDSGLTPLLEKAGAPHGFKPVHVAGLVDPDLDVGDDFFVERSDGERIDFRPILKQLISSELDADRMDYLRRDSLNAGVSYGQFDFDWLVGSLTSQIVLNPRGGGGRCYLALHHRALYSFEDFLISRFHMFLMVYFHYKSVVFDEMLGQYLASPDCDYRLPADIEAYCRLQRRAPLYGPPRQVAQPLGAPDRRQASLPNADRAAQRDSRHPDRRPGAGAPARSDQKESRKPGHPLPDQSLDQRNLQILPQGRGPDLRAL